MFNKRLQIIRKLELILEFGIFIENIENENQNRNNNICFVLLNYNDKIKIQICGPIMIFFQIIQKIRLNKQVWLVIYIFKRDLLLNFSYINFLATYPSPS